MKAAAAVALGTAEDHDMDAGPPADGAGATAPGTVAQRLAVGVAAVVAVVVQQLALAQQAGERDDEARTRRRRAL